MKKGWLKSYAQDGKKVAALSPEDAAIATVLMERNRGKNFVDRAFDAGYIQQGNYADTEGNDLLPIAPVPNSAIARYPSIPLGNEGYMSHFMAEDWGKSASSYGKPKYKKDPETGRKVQTNAMFEGPYRVYPTVVQDKSGNITQLDDDRAYDYAIETGEYIDAPTQRIASMLANKGYKKATGMPTYKKGGTIAKDGWTPNQQASISQMPTQGVSVGTTSANVPSVIAGQKFYDAKNFNERFRAARNAGMSEFEYKGKNYNTKLIPKEYSDEYLQSKKFLKDYIENTPSSIDTSAIGQLNYDKLNEEYFKRSVPKSWSEAYDSVKNLPAYVDPSTSFSEFDKISKYLDNIKSQEESTEKNIKTLSPDYVSYLDSAIKKEKLKSLNDPSYFSITTQKPKDMEEDGYWNAKQNKIFIQANPENYTTYVHELAHKANQSFLDRFSKNIPIPTPDMINKNKGAYNIRNSEDYEYLSNPTEVESRKMSALYAAKKKGIPVDENFVTSLKNNRETLPYDIGQLLDLYGPNEQTLLYYLTDGKHGKKEFAQGGMIRRADGSYSQRGLWDNIRANAGSGKKPTKEMLKQEKKIRAAEKKEYGGRFNQYEDGGQVNSIVDYLAAKGQDFSKPARLNLAKQYDVENYDFSAAKNIELLNKIKSNPTLPTELPTPVAKNYVDWDTIKRKKSYINNLPDEEKIKNYYFDKPDEQYLVVDKKKSQMNLYQGDKLLRTFEVGTGKNKGDAQTVTNVSDGKVNWSKGNWNTGAGIYTIDQIDPANKHYSNLPSFSLKNEKGIRVSNAIHATLPERLQYYGNDNLEDNRMSNGCINGKCEDVSDLYYKHKVKPGTKVFILPEENDNNFVLQDNRLIFKSSAKNRNKYKSYIDSEGNVQKGQGINTSENTINYSPIRILTDKGEFQKDVYQWNDLNDENEYQKTTKPFIQALVDNKQAIMKAASISSDVYNDIAKISFGIYGTESNFGDTHSAMGNFLRAGKKFFNPSGSSSPDYQSKYNTYGANEESRSAGLTQLRWNQLSKHERDVLQKLGITSNKDFLDPTKAAVGTAAVLGVRYNEQLNDEQKKDIYKNLPKRWNSRENYPDRVLNNSRYINIQEYTDKKYQNGGMIRRADGSYSQRGLWDNIRANAGSGKKPTKEMLKQERKIKAAEKKAQSGMYMPVANASTPFMPNVANTAVVQQAPSFLTGVPNGFDTNTKLGYMQYLQDSIANESRKRIIDKPYNQNDPTITLNTGNFRNAKVNTKVIDDAIASAKKKGIPVWQMIGMAGQETVLGSNRKERDSGYERPNTQRNIVSGWNTTEPVLPEDFEVYMAGHGVPGVKAIRTDKRYIGTVTDPDAAEKYLQKHPRVIDSYRKSQSLKVPKKSMSEFDYAASFLKEKGIKNYNPGEKAYSSEVNQRIKELSSDPVFMNYVKQKGYNLGAPVQYYQGGMIAEDGFSASDAALIREAVANQKSVPYQDMDPAMLKQYRLMEELSTAAGRNEYNKKKQEKQQADLIKQLRKNENQTAMREASYVSPAYSQELKRQYEVNQVIKPVLHGAEGVAGAMQLASFIPHPAAQAIGGIGDVVGTGLFALETGMDLGEGKYKDAAISAGLTAAPTVLGEGIRVASPYIQKGANAVGKAGKWASTLLNRAAGNEFTPNVDVADEAYNNFLAQVRSENEKIANHFDRTRGDQHRLVDTRRRDLRPIFERYQNEFDNIVRERQSALHTPQLSQEDISLARQRFHERRRDLQSRTIQEILSSVPQQRIRPVQPSQVSNLNLDEVRRAFHNSERYLTPDEHQLLRTYGVGERGNYVTSNSGWPTDPAELNALAARFQQWQHQPIDVQSINVQRIKPTEDILKEIGVSKEDADMFKQHLDKDKSSPGMLSYSGRLNDNIHIKDKSILENTEDIPKRIKLYENIKSQLDPTNRDHSKLLSTINTNLSDLYATDWLRNGFQEELKLEGKIPTKKNLSIHTMGSGTKYLIDENGKVLGNISGIDPSRPRVGTAAVLEEHHSINDPNNNISDALYRGINKGLMKAYNTNLETSKNFAETEFFNPKTGQVEILKRAKNYWESRLKPRKGLGNLPAAEETPSGNIRMIRGLAPYIGIGTLGAGAAASQADKQKYGGKINKNWLQNY